MNKEQSMILAEKSILAAEKKWCLGDESEKERVATIRLGAVTLLIKNCLELNKMSVVTEVAKEIDVQLGLA